MQDHSGNTVMSALNEQMCREVAKAGGGAYIHVDNNANAQRQLDEELDKLEKKETATTVFSDYDEQFQAICMIVLLLLIVEVCILDRKNPALKNVSLFGKGSKRAVLLLLLLAPLASGISPVQAQTDRQHIRQGNRLFRQGDFANAEVAYRKAVEKNPKNPQAVYNLGNALMAQKKDSAAVQQFEAASKLETTPLRQAMSFHNIGVICQTHQMYGEAIEAYKQALRLNPNDDETRYNLVLCKRQQKQQGQNQNNQQQKQDQKQDQQKQQDKQQMSRDNAEQLLQAAMQQERQTQQRMKEAQKQPQRRQNEKNW
jgi:Ca-activated chloride channel family protein